MEKITNLMFSEVNPNTKNMKVLFVIFCKREKRHLLIFKGANVDYTLSPDIYKIEKSYSSSSSSVTNASIAFDKISGSYSTSSQYSSYKESLKEMEKHDIPTELIEQLITFVLGDISKLEIVQRMIKSE